MNLRRVAVTGLGVVSPLGIGWEPFWKALLEGKPAFGPIKSFDPSSYRTGIGAEIKNIPERHAGNFARIAATQ